MSPFGRGHLIFLSHNAHGENDVHVIHLGSQQGESGVKHADGLVSDRQDSILLHTSL